MCFFFHGWKRYWKSFEKYGKGFETINMVENYFSVIAFYCRCNANVIILGLILLWLAFFMSKDEKPGKRSSRMGLDYFIWGWKKSGILFYKCCKSPDSITVVQITDNTYVCVILRTFWKRMQIFDIKGSLSMHTCSYLMGTTLHTFL